MNTIESSVGLRGSNRRNDVTLVQEILKKNGFPHLRVDGICGRNTKRAIIEYQKKFHLLPDGMINPGGKTIESLTSTSNTESLPTPHGSTATNPNGERKRASLMSPSFQCINLMKQYEVLKTKPYDDQTGRDTEYWKVGATIGYGHLIRESEFEKYKQGIDFSDADVLFNQDIRRFIAAVRDFVKVDVTQNEFDALVMFSFNIGTKDSQHQRGLYYSSVLKIINGESSENIDNAWMRYTISQGHQMRGLINRRRSELNVYHKGIYIKL
ncbi:Peptidoglycan-binding domain 1 protein [Dickeya chrysanthemi Ech1591]|uniref:Lysozyme n=1 Tax=Dickeya chrysanthemi (strain Ech1591) TaxID=561229 RepID=C6CPA8_DICC1|nr:peptidoglycan-binding protein [Dickeya chrysanthemi]ACT08849.1 Peptidoglycan-binding domain 1 protein [Dickeya chrysanthemi Ech1591]